eukprot:TRINITY_DN390_c0_g1_i1.p1 TRINITY_DN390_c0_g1~~TRINITY_DN390_c0_g1_i1.p1  ORF type:complete len:406 (-),score=3.55 TRINITY_DN390_c0_g1_i1:108-1325(-)
MKFILLLFALSMLATFSFGTWIGPIKLVDTMGACIYRVLSIYHDPTTRVHHVLYNAASIETFQRYLLVSDAGIVLNNITFSNANWDFTGVIRGVGDGQHVYMAMTSYLGSAKYAIKFTESTDGGKTWTTPSFIMEASSPDSYLQDMLYIAETGRVFVFFYEKNYKLKMVTRPPGSNVFSKPILVASNIYPPIQMQMNAKTVYSTLMDQQILHLFYANYNGRLAYMRSTTNGATWSPKLVPDDSLTHISAALINPKFSETIYVSYTSRGNRPAKLIKTEDHGITFTEPKPITKHHVHSATKEGLAICGTKSSIKLATFFTTTSFIGEYSWVDSKTLEPFNRPHPFTEPEIYTSALDCNLNLEKSQLSVTIIAARYVDNKADLFFAKETDFYPATEQNQPQQQGFIL